MEDRWGKLKAYCPNPLRIFDLCGQLVEEHPAFLIDIAHFL